MIRMVHLKKTAHPLLLQRVLRKEEAGLAMSPYKALQDMLKCCIKLEHYQPCLYLATK